MSNAGRISGQIAFSRNLFVCMIEILSKMPCMSFNIHSLITQIYFYASYIFQEAGISVEHIQYVTIGTGTCEFTACILCVSVHQDLICSQVILMSFGKRGMECVI